MKVLLLGSSNDTGEWFGGGKRRHEILRDRLAERFGEPVEVIPKKIWPNERIVSLIERWQVESDPDLVYINVTSYPFVYESLPLRIGRLLGPFGGPVRDAGLRLADSKRWAHNPAFRMGRSLAQTLIGGDTHFTCEEVIARFSESIRVAARLEGACVVVKGPEGVVSTSGGTGRERERKEAKRLYVDHELETFCRQLHVDYYGRTVPRWREKPLDGMTVGDGLHADAQGHSSLADDLFESVSASWSRHLAESHVKPL